VYVRSKDAPLAQSGDKRPSHDDARLSGALASCQTDDEADSAKTSSASSSSRASRGPRTRRASSTSASLSARRTARRTATRRGRRRTSTSTRRCTTIASASRRRRTCSSRRTTSTRSTCGSRACRALALALHVPRHGAGACSGCATERTGADAPQKHLLSVADLTKTSIGPDMEWTPIITEFDAAYHVCVSAFRLRRTR
jgi:hypothetical protein